MKKWILLLFIIMNAFSLPGIAVESKVQQGIDKNTFFHIFQLDPEKRKKLQEEKTVFSDFSEELQSEIALAGIHWFRYPIQTICKTYHSTNVLEQSPDFFLGQEIKPPITLDQFDKIQFTEDESEEVEKLLEVEPGDDYNLDQHEIEMFQRLRGEVKASEKSELYKQAEQLLQKILCKRFQSYYKHGLQGLKPYVRNLHDKIYPDRILKNALNNSTMLQQYLPHMATQLNQAPNNGHPKIKHRFFYYKQRIEDRPAFVLSHRLYLMHSNFSLVVERQFYVTHSYNSAQIMDCLISHQEGTMIASLNETFNEKIKGVLSGIAREVAESILQRKIDDFFDKLNRYLKSKE